MISFFKKHVTFQTSYLYCAFLMAFFLPLSIKISNVFLILFFVSASAVLIFFKNKPQTINYILLLYTLVPLFGLYIIGLFYSEPLFFGSSKIGKSISFLLCPIILLFHNIQSIQTIKKQLFFGIILGCIVSFLLLISINFINYYATRPFLLLDDEILNYYHTYYSFTQPVSIHPTYLGTYALLAIAILLSYFTTFSKTKKAVSIVSILILSIGILFLNSRVVILLYGLLMLITVISALKQLYFKKNFLLLLLLISFISTGGIFAKHILSDTFVMTRMTKELSWELSNQKNSNYNRNIKADSRIARWKSAIEIIQEKPLFGHGTKMEKSILKQQFILDGLIQSAKNRYDSHNMYLSATLEYGFVGLIVFLLYLISNLIYSLRKKNRIAVFFFIMLTIVCVFENYLANNSGITFVALFGSVMFFLNQKEIEIYI